MKTLLLAVLLVVTSTLALAAPTLTADAYPASAAPDAASLTINGGAPIACTLASSAAGVTPTCDLASIAVAGTYTLVLTVSRSAGCSSGTNAGSCGAAGSASSSPFAYTWRAGSVVPPVVRLAP